MGAETGTFRFTTSSESETLDAGRVLAARLADGDVISLAGDLGAGKTCLVRGVAEGLGVSGAVTSPTFNILVVHGGATPLNHFDLYRLERASQLEEIDFWGVMESGGASFVEWGDRFPGTLPEDHLLVEIRLGDGESEREFDLTPGGPRSREMASGWTRALESGDLRR